MPQRSKNKESAVKEACQRELHRLDQLVRDLSDKLAATPNNDLTLVDIHLALSKANASLELLLK